LSISTRTERCEFFCCVWVALWRCARSSGGPCRTDGPALDHRHHSRSSLCTFRRHRSARAYSRRHHCRRYRFADCSGSKNGHATVPQALGLGSAHCNRGFHQRCDHAVAVAPRIPRARTHQHCVRVGDKMNNSPLIALAGYFALLSLFAVGGANAAIPEMHRIAVEVMHWMSDRQFADSFAISQVSPGPNIIIVTLIGYHVAGLAGAAVATAAMCGPTCVLAFLVARTWDRFKEARWRIAIQAGLVPVSLGLIAASAFVL